MNLAVIGAGVVGLSVAAQLSTEFRDARVTVFADKFDDETTSWGAAGSFRVEDLSSVSSDKPDRTRQWCIDSMNHFWKLALSDQSCESGVSQLPMFQVYREKPRPPDYLNYVHCVKTLDYEDLVERFPEDISFGYSFCTTLTECRYYVPWLRKNFLAHPNGIIHRAHLQSFSDLSSKKYNLIFNCSGFGAKDLAHDVNVFPSRGQVFRVSAPWLKCAYYGPDNTYVYPLRDGVTVGGVRQKNNFNLEINPEDSKDIMFRATRLVPSLKNCQVLYQWVGLRPQRLGGIRLEREDRIIHCYGHGGNGVALSWGTAKDAVSLAKEFLRSSKL